MTISPADGRSRGGFAFPTSTREGTIPPATLVGTPCRSLVLLLAAVLTLLITVLGGPAGTANAVTGTASETITASGQNASGPAGPAAETRVGASTLAVGSFVGVIDGIAAGQRRGDGFLQPETVLATSVAAEDVGGGVVRHYTTDAAAESISKEGVLRPGASGKTWLTTDEYSSGAEAQGKLALNKTPDGYYEIPGCRVQCPSGPSTVGRMYGQPGGGTEITTGFPIDVSGLPFTRFGGG